MEIPYVPYEKTARYTPLPRPAAIKPPLTIYSGRSPGDRSGAATRHIMRAKALLPVTPARS